MASVDHKLRKDLLTLGYQFFLLQLCVVLIFSTSEFMIANLFSVQHVTTYNISFKYFGIVFMLANMLMAPLWGAFTNAWHQGDLEWIRKMIRRMHFLNLAFVLINVCLFFAFYPLTELWLGRHFAISNYLAIALIIFNAQIIFNNIFALFLNSIGKLRTQLMSGISGALINIPLMIVLARYTDLGLAAVCLANIICLLPGTILTSLETYKILKSGLSETNVFENASFER